MALDTGSTTSLHVTLPLGRSSGPASEAYSTLGSWLLAVRESRGDTLSGLAASTRIRLEHLKAIEADDFRALPSRPFAVGYVRAYARALGLDGETAVARLKREVPEGAQALQAPVGVAHEDETKRPVLWVMGGVVLAAVVLWNIGQRIMHQDDAAPLSLSTAVSAQPVEPQGPMKLSTPLPAPVEQSTPAPYLTPGLAEAAQGQDPLAALKAQEIARAVKAKATGGAVAPTPTVRAFETHAAIYGVAAAQSPVLVMATRPTSLIVRGAGRIFFARQLAVGEAYRAPMGQGLTLDSNDASALDLYVHGQLRGTLVADQTAIDQVAAPFLPQAPPAPRLQPALRTQPAPRP